MKKENPIKQSIPVNDWESEMRLLGQTVDFLKEIRLEERKKVIEEIRKLMLTGKNA